VSQLAKSVNGVLSTAYRDIYATSEQDDVGLLQLLTSPINSTEEVLQLYNGGLVPAEIAVPSVLNAIGASKDEIDAALERVVAERTQQEAAASAGRTQAAPGAKGEEDEKPEKAEAAASDQGGSSKQASDA
jgi:hypothetical protein